MGLEGLEATGLFSVVSGRGKGQKGSEREQKKIITGADTRLYKRLALEFSLVVIQRLLAVPSSPLGFLDELPPILPLPVGFFCSSWKKISKKQGREGGGLAPNDRKRFVLSWSLSLFFFCKKRNKCFLLSLYGMQLTKEQERGGGARDLFLKNSVGQCLKKPLITIQWLCELFLYHLRHTLFFPLNPIGTATSPKHLRFIKFVKANIVFLIIYWLFDILLLSPCKMTKKVICWLQINHRNVARNLWYLRLYSDIRV